MGLAIKVGHYTVRCSWCGEVIEIKPTVEASMFGVISHGICSKCEDKVSEEIKAYKVKGR